MTNNQFRCINSTSAIKRQDIVGASRPTASPFPALRSDTTSPTANVKVSCFLFSEENIERRQQWKFIARSPYINPIVNQFQGKSSPSRRSPQGKKPRKGMQERDSGEEESEHKVNHNVFFFFFLCFDLGTCTLGCTPGDKAAFNGHLIRLFTTEFNRLPTTPIPSKWCPVWNEIFSPGRSLFSWRNGCESNSFSGYIGTAAQVDGVTETAERRVMEWKFAQLDKNGDGQLIRREFRVLRRLVRKVVRPKRCAKNFPRLCDTDQDRKISRSEWSVCLGIGINSK